MRLPMLRNLRYPIRGAMQITQRRSTSMINRSRERRISKVHYVTCAFRGKYGRYGLMLIRVMKLRRVNKCSKQMEQIFWRVSEVIAWLGPNADDSDLAVNWIVRFGSWAAWAHELEIGATSEMSLRVLLTQFEEDTERV